MSFDWSEYLEVARELVGQSTRSPAASQEAKQRSAISRAYYAAFIKARKFLINEGVNIPRGNTHRFVINKFQNSRVQKRQNLGVGLKRLRIIRNKGDYEDTMSKLVEETQKALTLARRIILVLSSL